MNSNPHQRSNPSCLAWAAWSVLAAAATGCQGTRDVASRWPPPDFGVELHVFEVHENGSEHLQRFEVDAEGLAIYRESRGDLAGAPLRVPVFSTVAVYQLDPRSLRTLSRMLSRTGLFEADGETSSNASDRGRQVTVLWQAHEADGRLSTLSVEIGPLERVVRVLESFLPDGRRVLWPGELSQAPLDPSIEEAPEPLDFLPGAVAVHTEIARRNPEDEWALLELFAVAVAAEDFEAADDALTTLASLAQDWGADAVDAEAWRAEVVGPLRAMLEARRRQAGGSTGS